jgi:hypothetical protein
MKTFLCVCAVTVVCLAGTVVPAQAAGRACVTVREYGQVHRGMSLRSVHRVFDTRGRRVVFFSHDGFSSEIRRYRGCARLSIVSVAYNNGRLRSKSAVWGR